MTNPEELLHALRNDAAVIKAAAAELRDGADTLPPETMRELTGMVAQRSERVLELLDRLGTGGDRSAAGAAGSGP